MRSWKEVELPGRMKDLEKDSRGYPVPYIILRDKNNKPHFQINDEKFVIKCLRQQLCPICGQKLDGEYWLAGGALSGLHPNGVFIDSMSHYVCLEYSMKVCPYLAVSLYNKRLDTSTLDEENFNGFALLDPTMMPERPKFFVLGKTSGYTVDSKSRHISPIRPWLEIEYWNNGERISKQGAEELVRINNLNIVVQ